VAVPLFLWLLVDSGRDAAVTPRRAAWLGFIASLAVLARLDLAMAVAFLIVGWVVLTRPSGRVFWTSLTAFCAGGLLLPLYLGANVALFGSPFPTSMLAKRLSTGIGFNVKYAELVALGTVYGRTIAIVLPVGLLALLAEAWRDPRARTAATFTGGVALVFAFTFFGLNALTGWTFFGWYAYPLAVATIPAIVFIVRWATPMLRPRALAIGATAAVVALLPVRAATYYLEHGPHWSVSDNTLLAMSYELAERLDDRDGLFAMGAIAGMATYVLDKPVLQLEGLVADRRMVEHIRRETPLHQVLSDYGADYLVVSLASVPAVSEGGCYLITQPNAEWAGDRTPKMRGTLCSEPMERFVTPKGSNPWSRFPALETFVWDLRKADRGSLGQNRLSFRT
jgi:hypothetical protein